MADKYVDFSAANDGDGTAYNQAASGGATGAWNTLVGKSPTGGDKVWIRRQTKGGQTATWSTAFVASVDYIGWPISGDPFYASRPDGGAHAAWDGDADDYAQVTFTANSIFLNINAAITSLHRFKVVQTTQNCTFGIIQVNAVCELWNCYAHCTSVNSGGVRAFFISYRVKMYNCIGEGGRGFSSKSGSTIGGNFYFTNGANHYRSYLYNCTSKGSQSLNYGFYMGDGDGADYSTFVDCTVEDNPTYGMYLANGPVNIIGATINAQTGMRLSGGPYARAFGLKFVNCDRYLEVTIAAVIHVQEATQDSAANPAMQISGGMVLLFLDDAVTFHVSNTDDFSVNEAATMLFVFTRGKSEITNRAVTNQFIPGQWGSDFGGTLGAFAVRAANADVDGDDSVTRDSGGPVSIKIASKATYNVPGLDFFSNPLGMETIYVPLVAGSQTLTLYGAHKGFTIAPNKTEVWFEFNYLDEAATSVSRPWVHTREMADLESDSSTWTGETGETAFKITKTVTVGQDCIAAVRIGAGRYESGALIYIDPKIVVT